MIRVAAVIAGSIAGLGVLASWPAVRRASKRISIPVAIAILVGLASAGTSLVTLGEQTVAFAREGQTDIGRRPPPIPREAVAAARGELRSGETWTLFTDDGQCREDSLRYFWIAFQLLPNAADCDGAASVIIAYRLGDFVEAIGTVVAEGDRWAVIRP